MKPPTPILKRSDKLVGNMLIIDSPICTIVPTPPPYGQIRENPAFIYVSCIFARFAMLRSPIFVELNIYIDTMMVKYIRSIRNPAIGKENVINSKAITSLGREFSTDITVC